MTPTTLRRQSSPLRRRFIAYVALIAFIATFVPAVGIAQQPTATVSALTGTVLVNGQVVTTGTVLGAGDVMQTQKGAGVVLELSDGSQVEIEEDTRLDLAQLLLTDTGARVSKIKLAWGWIRAKLSPGHQQAGSKFDIETPNALVGVKFSQPELEIGYVRDTEETRALANTVPLTAKNLITGEEAIVPVGSTVVITATGLQIITGLIEAGAVTAGMGNTTKIALGAGAALAVGGGVALAVGGGDSNGGDSAEEESNGDVVGSFSGTWVYETPYERWTFILIQDGNSIRGEYTATLSYHPDRTEQKWGNISGYVANGIAYLEFLGGMAQLPGEEPFSYNPDPSSCVLRNGSGTYLYCDDWMRFDQH